MLTIIAIFIGYTIWYCKPLFFKANESSSETEITDNGADIKKKTLNTQRVESLCDQESDG